MTDDFARQPATKQDVADVRESLVSLESSADSHDEKLSILDEKVERLTSRIDQVDIRLDTIEATMKNGFESIEKLLSRPPYGLGPRVKQLEEAVGIHRDV